MPVLTQPLHEFNHCHEPSGSAAGGQFCSTPAPSPAQFRQVPYLRNTVSSRQYGHFGSRFQQDIEPAGQYFLADETGGTTLPSGWERGTKTFQQPLVVEWNGSYDATSWKAQLYARYRKKGKALSRALRKQGYDAIITVQRGQDGRWETSEMVDLSQIR